METLSNSSVPAKSRRYNWIGIAQVVLTVVFLAIIAWFVYTHSAEIGEVMETLRRGNWLWLTAAVAVEGYYFYLVSWYFESYLRLVGIRITRFTTILNMLAAQPVGVVTPTEFLGVQGVFINHAIRTGQSRSRTVLGAMFAQISELYAFVILIIIGMAILLFWGKFSRVEAVSMIVLLALVAMSVVWTVIVLYRPHYFKVLAGFGNRLMRRLGHKTDIIPADQIGSLYEGLVDGSKSVRKNPATLYDSILVALAAHIVRVLCLWLIARAFDLDLSPLAAIIAYCFGNLAWLISPVPQGIGLVEGAYAVALAKLGLPIAGAATLALAFRGVTFWLPFLLGLPTLRYLNFQPARDVALGDSPKPS